MRTWIVGLVLVLAGCATPPGKLNVADMVSETYVVHKPLAETYAALQENSRYCGGLINGLQPKWYPSISGKTAKVDLYQPSAFGGASELVNALINMEQKGQSTVVTVSATKLYNQPLFHKYGWWKPVFGRIVSEINNDKTPSCD